MSKHVLIALLLAAAGLWAQTGPALTATAAPTSISFNYQIGAAKLPAAQTVSVRANAGTPTFATAIGVNSPWLAVSPDTGKLPGSLSLQVNPTTLSVGTYSATVSVTVFGIAIPLLIPATLTVSSPPSTLTLSSAALSFVAPPGSPLAQTVQLSTSSSPVTFTAASGSPWLSVSPAVGVVLPGEQVSLSVNVDPSGLSPQAAPYTGKITITQGAGAGSAAKAQTVTISLTVNSSTPTIASVWPPILPVNGGPQTITLRGSFFYSATTVKIHGASSLIIPTVLSPSALLAVIPAAQLTAAGTLQVIVSNPAPGGDSSAAALVVGNVPSIAAIVNVASYGAVSISPGELVTIFGANLGPVIPSTMTVTNGFVDTGLGGVTVSIDHQAAPLLYVSQSQITVQVPFEVTQGAGKQVTVTNGTNPPAMGTVSIGAAAPGLFTSAGSGSNQAAALNFDSSTGYTLNTASNPVKIGDQLILYLTGEGDYNPTITPRTGLVIPSSLNPLPMVNPLPVVTIGGAQAAVSYAGPLVGSMLGLLQINATVPAGATTGQAVPVIVNIGANGSQTGVTVSVHP